MKKYLLMAVAALMATMNVNAQEDTAAEQFTVATLNVDGLPQKVLVIKLNPDGPGDTGTARIGKYLVNKGYDLLMLQEDFNYHGVLSVLLEDDYNMDEWSGDVGIDGHSIDFLHLQNHRFACDGLMACWKKDLTVTPAARTAWTDNFGKFSHANDEMVTKGFRRYDVTLRNGTRLTVYNMHMDATLDEDEEEGKSMPDHDARMAQWAQLKADVLETLGTHPIIITGDLNSLYCRDEVKQDFIDAINDSGRGKAADVWIELVKDGVYPSTRSESWTSGETLDKILYINPTTGTKIQPVAITTDREGYLHDGKPLGDHWPVTATFQVGDRKATDVTQIEDRRLNIENVEDGVYDLQGRQIVDGQLQKGVYIQNGKKTVIR